MDLLRLQIGDGIVINQDYIHPLVKLKEVTNKDLNLQLLVYLESLRKQLCQGMNFNKQLFLEAIFIKWMKSLLCN